MTMDGMDGKPLCESSLLILPDGRLLVRNVTPEMAALLLALQPENPDLTLRTLEHGPSQARPVDSPPPVRPLSPTHSNA
ncbi:MAG: hypothetical protein EOP86_11390 [Verrucomicrobiaceae bacterium]|nr:MAG: hypothetical protein EOP86_11390 [Verrucomicrobiaceae bacterium]